MCHRADCSITVSYGLCSISFQSISGLLLVAGAVALCSQKTSLPGALGSSLISLHFLELSMFSLLSLTVAVLRNQIRALRKEPLPGALV